ncbi:MAG: translation initiation factor IF-2 [Deltaproteobacteria bacterium]|nr:MAG: translation initiation factor IF-2 [Deltaproteobacteria bacterium]
MKVREEKPEPETTPEGEVQPEAEKPEVPAEPEISEAVEKETKEVAEKPAEPLKEQKVEKVEAKLKEEAKKVPEAKEPEKPEKARIVKPAAPEKEISEAALEAKIVEKKEELAKKIEKPATKEEEKIKAVKPEPEKPKADAREEALEVSKVEKPEKPPVKPAKKVKKEKKEEAAVIISLPEKLVEPVEKEKEKKEVAEKKPPIDLEEARKARVAKKDKPPVPEKKPALTKKKKGVKIEPFAIPEAKPGKPERRKVVSKEDLYSEAELKTQRIIKSKKGAKAARAEKQFQKPEITVPKAIKRRLKIDEAITVANLAKRMGIAASEVIKKLMELGLMVNVNQSIDFDTAVLVAEEFGFEVEKAAFEEEEILKTESDREEDLKPRPPVVTIMGHVDHGKTSLLDVIRESNITEKEAGGITQHIGAYQVKVDGGEVTFLDTPGHEAFTSMRARGAQVTDLVVLVVAADDGVMQQTIEAINHAKAADIPILVAINKIDKPNANPDRVKRELAEHGLIPEEWGGDTTMVEVSAKKNIGIDDLLEMILLQAEILELKANPNKPARGRIIEAKLDRGRGPVATVLVQEGTLKIGDFFVCGVHHGKVRALFDSNRQRILKATPSMPVEIQGISGVPTAGDDFVVVASEKQAKMISEHRQRKQRETELSRTTKVTLEKLYEHIKEGEIKELNIILKTDVQGTLEAISDSLRKLETDEIRVNIIHSATGGISETDVMLASASNAIIIGFNVRADMKVLEMAEREQVDLRFYDVIYQLIADVKDALEGMLEPEYREVVIGRAEVRQTFNIPKVGTVAGCYVVDGKLERGCQVHLVRDGIVVYQGKIASLKRFKDDVKEVKAGYECGVGIENFNDVKVNDVLEAYILEEIKPSLDTEKPDNEQ